MAVRGRNAGPDLNIKVAFTSWPANTTGNTTVVSSNPPIPGESGNFILLYQELRSQFTIKEVGATATAVTSGSLAGSATMAFWIWKPGETYPKRLATLEMATTDTVGSVFTTRDGSIPWYNGFADSDKAALDAAAKSNTHDYNSPGVRVFPVGTLVFACWSTGTGVGDAAGNTSQDTDRVVPWIVAEEFGAPPL